MYSCSGDRELTREQERGESVDLGSRKSDMLGSLGENAERLGRARQLLNDGKMAEVRREVVSGIDEV
jgi:hypothetical protein